MRGGMPVLLLSAGQAGATSPAALAGTVVQEMAECLAGLVYVNAHQARRAGHLRHLAVRLGSAHRRHVGRQPGAGAALGGLRADGAVLRPDRRHRVGHDRLQDARRAGGLREGLQPRARRQCRREPDLRVGRHACEPARASAWRARHRQRHHRRDAAHHARHRGQRRERSRSRRSATTCLGGPGHYLGSDADAAS